MKCPIIEINLDKKCKRCKKVGATQTGYCMECITKNIKKGKYEHLIQKITSEREEDENIETTYRQM